MMLLLQETVIINDHSGKALYTIALHIINA